MATYFQDTTTGLIAAFPLDLTLEEAKTKYPALPDTLSATVIPYPGAGHVWANGAWELDTTAQNALLKGPAKIALDQSDTVIIRCAEAGASVPQEWKDYRAALRALVSGADTTSTNLPSKPAYPAGT
jgi:hypothetical protein